MASYNNKFSNNRNGKSFSTETIALGTYIHPSEDMLVLKLQCKDIPYPNSSVLHNKKQIGKVDEVFGPIDDVYVAVKLEPGQKLSDFSVNTKFEAYKDKFIFKERFLPREEVEKRKEISDKKKDNGNKGFGGNKKNFSNDRNSDRKRDFGGQKKSFNGNQKNFGNDRNKFDRKKDFNKKPHNSNRN